MTEIVTQDRRMLEIIQLVKTVAPSKATVLIQGESGTGKERMGGLLHQNSNRAAKPFVAINCAAIPENLLESELFGYERGAFTGANALKQGRFEQAHGGTLFLDEISEMDLKLQAKLLRVIQEGEVDRLGGKKPVPVDVRLVATTNRNLAECVRDGSFREDLYYRLNVVNVTLPPLRERTMDVRTLAERFMREIGEKNSKRVVAIAEEAYRILEMHTWPGNIRELENVIERAVLTSQGGVIYARDITIAAPVMQPQAHFVSPAVAIADADMQNWTPGTTLDQIEKSVILDALKYHMGNRTHTAKALGISIRTLRNKLADYRRDGLQV